MARNVKGLIVEIGGDTSELEKALKKSQQTANGFMRELEDINRLLKINPKSALMSEQKQLILNKALLATRSHLEVLNGQYKKNAFRLQELYAEQEKLIERGDDIDNTRAWRSNAKAIEENELKQRNLTREIEIYTNKEKVLSYKTSFWSRASESLENTSKKLKVFRR